MTTTLSRTVYAQLLTKIVAPPDDPDHQERGISPGELTKTKELSFKIRACDLPKPKSPKKDSDNSDSSPEIEDEDDEYTTNKTHKNIWIKVPHSALSFTHLSLLTNISDFKIPEKYANAAGLSILALMRKERVQYSEHYQNQLRFLQWEKGLLVQSDWEKKKREWKDLQTTFSVNLPEYNATIQQCLKLKLCQQLKNNKDAFIRHGILIPLDGEKRKLGRTNPSNNFDIGEASVSISIDTNWFLDRSLR